MGYRGYGFKEPITVYRSNNLFHAGKMVYSEESGEETWKIFFLCTQLVRTKSSGVEPSLGGLGSTSFKESVQQKRRCCNECRRILGI